MADNKKPEKKKFDFDFGSFLFLGLIAVVIAVGYMATNGTGEVNPAVDNFVRNIWSENKFAPFCALCVIVCAFLFTGKK